MKKIPNRTLAEQLRDEWRLDTDDARPIDEVFREEPPNLIRFVAEKKFMWQDTHGLGPIQYDVVRHFEQVLFPKTYILMVEEFGRDWLPVRHVNELAVEWGKGSGKDHVCQISLARIANILLCMKNPQEYFGLGHQSIIHCMNVAVSAQQAHGVFFKPLRSLITQSSWFADKFEVSRSNTTGEPGPQAQEIRFANQVELISGHSSAEGLEGKNLIAAIADEISAFPTMAEVNVNKAGRIPAKTADGILEMLRSSATTRFPHTFKLAQISYPRYKGDAIQQAVAEAELDILEKGAASVYYVSGPKKTWDVNPRYDTIERIKVKGALEPVPNVDSIIKDYQRKPAYARAKYECAPDLAENRFFANDTAIYESFSEQRTVPPLTLEYWYGVEEQTDKWAQSDQGGELKEKEGWQVRFHFAPDMVPYRGVVYAIHGDMAITRDAAGIAMSHVRSWERREWTKEDGSQTLEARPIVKVDFATAFEADPGSEDPTGKAVPREVQIRWFRKLVFELVRRNFTIGMVTFDRFASADTIQILNARGIESDRFSTDTTNVGWDTLRDVMYDGRLEGYYHEKLIHELRSLNEMPNGKIDHPPAGSKDIADAVAGSVVAAIELGGDETDAPERADEAAREDLYTIPGHGGNISDYAIEGSWDMSPSDFGLS